MRHMNPLIERIQDYLSNSGLFNPETIEHDKVGKLLLDCREEITSLEIRLSCKEDDSRLAKTACAENEKLRACIAWMNENAEKSGLAGARG